MEIKQALLVPKRLGYAGARVLGRTSGPGEDLASARLEARPWQAGSPRVGYSSFPAPGCAPR